MFSNISNPKIVIFYFAYMPQFIVHGSFTNETMQLFVLGASFAIMTFFIKAPLAYASGLFSSYLKNRPSILNIIDKISGSILILLGLKLAFSQKSSV